MFLSLEWPVSRSEFGTTLCFEIRMVKFGIRNVQPPRNIVGPVVRRLREEAGYSQPMLVARLNLDGWDISRETLAKIESQIRWVADFELLRLAKALKCDLPGLFPAPSAPEDIPRRRKLNR
jgi:DNA-binding XRE family transcriptional regulator